MGKQKRLRKAMSANKAVKKAVKATTAMYMIIMNTMVAVHQVEVGAIVAQKMKKGGVSHVKENMLAPLEKLTGEVIYTNNVVSNTINQSMVDAASVATLMSKLKELKEESV